MSKLTNKDNLDKLAKALDSRSKALVKASVAEETARAQGIESDLQEQIETTQDMFGGKSIRYITQEQYNQLTDEEKNDPSVAYFIIDAEDLSHKHDNKSLLDSFGARTITIGNTGKTFDGSANVSWTLSEIGAAASGHNHDDRYYTETEVNTKVTDLQVEIDADVKVEADRAKAAEAALQAAIDGKAGSTHNHDDRYFTESEVNTKLSTLKSDLQAEIDADVLAEANRAKGVENSLQAAIDGKSPLGHAHDDRYLTEDEVEDLVDDLRLEIENAVNVEEDRALAAEAGLQAAIDGKANASHGLHVPTVETANNARFLRNDNTWQTVTPANIGAANKTHSHDDLYYTEAEIDAKVTTLNNAINGKAPSSHSHNDLYFTESEINAIVSDLQEEIDADVLVETNRAKDAEAALQANIDKKANSSHTHDDRYFTETEMTNTLANLEVALNEALGELEEGYEAADIALQAAINGKSPLGHTHDDRYFTETEVTSRLAEKSDVGHDHADLYYDKDELDLRFTNMGNAFNGMTNTLANKADKNHTHDDRYYTETEIDGKIEELQEEITDAVEVEATRAKAAEATLQANIDGKAASGHTHDDRYYTESEVNTKLAGKSDTSHTHDDRYYTETEMDVKLATKAALEHGTHVAYSTAAPKANGTASAGSASEVARADHVHPLQTAISGNAGSADKLSTARTLTIGNTGKTFDGSANVSWSLAEIGAAASGHTHNVLNYQDTRAANPAPSEVPQGLSLHLKSNGTDGVSNGGSYHPVLMMRPWSNISGGPYTQLTITQNNNLMFRTSASDTAWNSWVTVYSPNNKPTPADIGAAASSHGTHVTWATAVPQANGTAAIGSVNRVAREDHIHPLQESVEKLTTARTITIGNQGVEFDGSENISFTVSGIGAAASGHTHDDRYYTESEINTKVTNLQAEIDADVKVEADRAKAAEATLQANIDKKANASHGNHVPTTQTANNAVFLRNDNTWATVTPANIGAAASSHTHDDRYYTETEIDAKVTTINTAIATAKSDAQSYADTKIAALVDSAPDALNTLNELATAITDHQDVYDAYVTEVDAKLAGKSDTGHTHSYAGSSSAGGAATSANKVNSNLIVKLNGGATEGTNLFTFNGSAAKTINITPSGIGAANSSHGTHVTYATTTPKANGTAAIGSSGEVARADHVHPLQTTVSGNAGSADKLSSGRTITIGNKSNTFDGTANISYTLAEIGASATGHTHNYAGSGSAGGAATSANKVNSNLVVKLNSGTTEGTNMFTFNGSAAKTINITPSGIGAAASSHGTHVDYATAAGKAPGTAAVGTSTKVAREDHVHPLQTSVSGNAGTATTLATARTITIGNKANTFDGSANISYTLSEIGAAASGHTHNYAGSSSAGGVANSAAKLSSARSIQIGNQSNNFDGTGNISYSLSSMGALALAGGNMTGVLGVKGSYDLGSYYNYTEGCLIEIGAAAGQTMVVIHVTGNSYSTGTTPINSLYQFYDYTSDGGVMSQSGICLGHNTGDMKVYRANSKLYAYIKQTASYHTMAIRVYSNKSDLSPKVTNAAMPTSGYTNLTTITPKVASVNGHTHNYAGSSSAGGAANTAVKLHTARTLTIGSTGKEFDGTGNLSWTLAEIGAAASGHTHTYYNRTAVGDIGWGTTSNQSLPTTVGAIAYWNGAYSGTNSNLTYCKHGAFGTAATKDTGYFATASHGTHVTYSTTAPKVAGTAAVGSESTVARGDHVHAAQTTITGNAGSATKLQNAKTITIGNKSNTFDGTANITYTLAQIGASPLQKTVVSKTVSSGTLTLSTDRYQTATLASGNTIALPSVSAFTEINLFVKDCAISTINLPDNCKWRVDPNLESGDSFMFTFFYTGQEWLAEVKIYS